MSNPLLDSNVNQTIAADINVGMAGRDVADFSGFEPPEFEEEIPFHETLGEGFMDSGVITGLSKALGDTVDNTPDPAYNIEEYFNANPERLSVLQPYMDDLDHPASGSILSELHDTRNVRQLERLLFRIEEANERARRAAINPVSSFIGTLGGIGLDVGAAAAVSVASGGTGAILPVVTAARGARLLGAARAGAIGAAEGGGERAAQSITNPIITFEDILETAGLGGGFGALLGVAFPLAIGGVRTLARDLEQHVVDDALIAEAKATRVATDEDPVGAQVVDTVVSEPAKGAGSLLAGKILPGKAGVLRSPKRVIVDEAVRAFKEFRERGTRGGVNFYQLMNRTLRFGVVNVEEVGGAVARKPSVQDLVNDLEFLRIQRNTEASDEYTAAMKEIFGGKRPLTGTGPLGAAGRFVNEKLGRQSITREQYEALADEIAQARGDKVVAETKFTALQERLSARIEKLEERLSKQTDPERKLKAAEDLKKAQEQAKKAASDAVEIAERPYLFPEDIRAMVPDNELELLRPHLEKTSLRDDAYYDALGKKEVELGLLPPEQLIPGYRPQRWNKEEILKDVNAFDHFLRRIINKNPSDKWVNENIKIKDTNGKIRSVLDEGETFDDLAKRDPELADDIADEWAAANRDNAIEKLNQAQAKLELEEARLGVGTANDMEQRTLEAISTARNTVLKLQAELDAIKVNPNFPHDHRFAREPLAKKVGAAEKKLADLEGRLNDIRNARRSVAELQEFIIANGNKGERAAMGVAMKRTGAVLAKEARVQARKMASEEVDEIRTAILNGENPWGFVDSEFVETSRRLKRRTLILGQERFTDDARRFLLTNAHDARASFGASMNPQLAIQEVFGTGAGKVKLTDLRDDMLKVFDEDLKKFPGDKKILQARARASALFDGIFREITHADITGLHGGAKNFADFASTMNSATAAMSLGSVLFAQVGDIPILAVSGGKIGTGFKSIFSRQGKNFKEIMNNDPQMAVLLKGANTLDSSRYRAVSDIDNAGFDIPGSKFRMVKRVTDGVALAEGWANFMHVWNMWVRGSFGLDFARQINDDMAKPWASLPEPRRTFYAKIGIDEGFAKRYTAKLAEDGTDYVDGNLRLPNSESWAKTDADLIERYRRAIQAAGDEALLDPGIGDRPFLRSNPAGRMILQFQSFMFTAGDRFIAPMIQEMQLHPTSIRPYVGALLGMAAGGISDGLKEAAKGRGDAWLDRWDRPEGVRDNLWASILRSPLMAGPSSMLTELALTQGGRPVNEAVEALTGARPLKEAATRFQENQGLFSLLGPSAGNILGTGPAIAKKFLRGDTDAAIDQVTRKLPIMNTFYLQTLARYLKE